MTPNGMNGLGSTMNPNIGSNTATPASNNQASGGLPSIGNSAPSQPFMT